jgi:hypothetical protein
MVSGAQSGGSKERASNQLTKELIPNTEAAGGEVPRSTSRDAIDTASRIPIEKKSPDKIAADNVFKDILERREQDLRDKGIFGPDKNDLAYVRSDEKPEAWYRFWQKIAKRYGGLSTGQKIITLVGGIGSVAALGYVGIHNFITNAPSEETPLDFGNYEFNPASMKSVIGRNNIVQMTIEDYRKNAPPLWEDQEKTLTIPLPILFRDNRIPVLHVEKSLNFAGPILDVITIDGLEQGDRLCSPIDGNIELSPDGDNVTLRAIFLKGTDNKGNHMSIIFSTTGLKPLIDFNLPITEKKLIPVKQGDPIGTLLKSDRHTNFKGQIQITGNDLHLENFNFGISSEKKLIVLQ